MLDNVVVVIVVVFGMWRTHELEQKSKPKKKHRLVYSAIQEYCTVRRCIKTKRCVSFWLGLAVCALTNTKRKQKKLKINTRQTTTARHTHDTHKAPWFVGAPSSQNVVARARDIIFGHDTVLLLCSRFSQTSTAMTAAARTEARANALQSCCTVVAAACCVRGVIVVSVWWTGPRASAPWESLVSRPPAHGKQHDTTCIVLQCSRSSCRLLPSPLPSPFGVRIRIVQMHYSCHTCANGVCHTHTCTTQFTSISLRAYVIAYSCLESFRGRLVIHSEHCRKTCRPDVWSGNLQVVPRIANSTLL